MTELTIDNSLVFEVGRVSNGETIHGLNNKLAVYTASVYLYNTTHKEEYLEIFNRLTQSLRQIVHTQRMRGLDLKKVSDNVSS